jgi:hypothetical protein
VIEAAKIIRHRPRGFVNNRRFLFAAIFLFQLCYARGQPKMAI